MFFFFFFFFFFVFFLYFFVFSLFFCCCFFFLKSKKYVWKCNTRLRRRRRSAHVLSSQPSVALVVVPQVRPGLALCSQFLFSFLYCFKFWPASPQQVLLRTSSGRLASVSFAALMYFRHNWGCSSSKNLSDLFGSRSVLSALVAEHTLNMCFSVAFAFDVQLLQRATSLLPM